MVDPKDLEIGKKYFMYESRSLIAKIKITDLEWPMKIKYDIIEKFIDDITFSTEKILRWGITEFEEVYDYVSLKDIKIGEQYNYFKKSDNTLLAKIKIYKINDGVVYYIVVETFDMTFGFSGSFVYGHNTYLQNINEDEDPVRKILDENKDKTIIVMNILFFNVIFIKKEFLENNQHQHLFEESLQSILKSDQSALDISTGLIKTLSNTEDLIWNKWKFHITSINIIDIEKEIDRIIEESKAKVQLVKTW